MICLSYLTFGVTIYFIIAIVFFGLFARLNAAGNADIRNQSVLMLLVSAFLWPYALLFGTK